jgi:hypothetical protein
VLAAAWCLRRGAHTGRERRFLEVLGWAFAWAPAYVAAYAYGLRYYWTWYAGVPLLVWTCFVSGAADALCRRASARGGRTLPYLAAALVAVSVAHAGQFLRRVPPTRPTEEQRLMPLFQLVNRVAGPDTWVGSWNSGAFGYFGPFHTAGIWVNLDGVVNNYAFDAVRRGEYGRWLATRVHFLVEPPSWGSPFFTEPQFHKVFARFQLVSREPFLAANRDLAHPR